MWVFTEVSRESEDLLPDEHVEGVDGGVAEDLFPVNLVVGLLRDAKVLAGLGDVHLVTLHRGVVGVVSVVGDFPGEIRGPEEAMCDLRRMLVLD